MVYRLVGGVLLMGVVRRGACVLRLLRLLDAATRLLVAAARTVDVTPDKLARRYPEVCPQGPSIWFVISRRAQAWTSRPTSSRGATQGI